MSDMLRHRNTPYSCGCCSPYFDNKNSTRSAEEKRWRRRLESEYGDDLQLTFPEPIDSVEQRDLGWESCR